MPPSVYRYEETNEGHKLYLGSFSTQEGLSIFLPQTTVALTEAGASNYKQYGWATEKNFPEFKTAHDIVHFLKNEEVYLIHFEVILHGIGNLRTHDDSECSFTLKDRKWAIDIIKTVAPLPHQNKILSGLLNNPGLYITISPAEQIQKYHSFDDYLKSLHI